MPCAFGHGCGCFCLWKVLSHKGWRESCPVLAGHGKQADRISGRCAPPSAGLLGGCTPSMPAGSGLGTDTGRGDKTPAYFSAAGMDGMATVGAGTSPSADCASAVAAYEMIMRARGCHAKRRPFPCRVLSKRVVGMSPHPLARLRRRPFRQGNPSLCVCLGGEAQPCSRPPVSAPPQAAWGTTRPSKENMVSTSRSVYPSLRTRPRRSTQPRLRGELGRAWLEHPEAAWPWRECACDVSKQKAPRASGFSRITSCC